MMNMHGKVQASFSRPASEKCGLPVYKYVKSNKALLMLLTSGNKQIFSIKFP